MFQIGTWTANVGPWLNFEMNRRKIELWLGENLSSFHEMNNGVCFAFDVNRKSPLPLNVLNRRIQFQSLEQSNAIHRRQHQAHQSNISSRLSDELIAASNRTHVHNSATHTFASAIAKPRYSFIVFLIQQSAPVVGIARSLSFSPALPIVNRVDIVQLFMVWLCSERRIRVWFVLRFGGSSNSSNTLYASRHFTVFFSNTNISSVK